MAIEAITNVKNNGIGSVNFEARKNKKSAPVSNPTVTSTVKAIPLAVLIAMSPITTTNAESIMRGEANTNIIELTQSPEKITSKQSIPNALAYYGGKQALEISYIDTDGRPSTFESIRMESENCISSQVDENNDFSGYAKSLCNYNFSIVGDDGKEYGQWKYSQVAFAQDKDKNSPATFFVARPNVINIVKNIINSDGNNNSISVKNISKTLYPKRDGALTTIDKRNKAELYRQKVVPSNFGYQVFEGEITTQVGKYKIIGYTNDSNKNNYEFLVLQRDDGLNVKLDGIRQVSLNLNTQDDHSDDNITLNCIDVSWPNVGEFSIYDDELFAALLNTAYKDSRNNKSIKVTEMIPTVTINENGYPKQERNTVRNVL